jgi:hypothetical protein
MTAAESHWTVVREVISTTTTGADLMSAMPGLVKRLLDEEAWRSFAAPAPAGFVEHDSFTSFLATGSPRGLGGRRDQLMALCGIDEALKERVRQLLDEEVPQAAPRGGDRRSAEFQTSATHLKENTAEHLLSRLKRARPELAERVVRGELTANAAAQQAGIRKPRIVLTSPASIAAALRRNLSEADVAELARLLAEQQPA